MGGWVRQRLDGRMGEQEVLAWHLLSQSHEPIVEEGSHTHNYRRGSSTSDVSADSTSLLIPAGSSVLFMF